MNQCGQVRGAGELLDHLRIDHKWSVRTVQCIGELAICAPPQDSVALGLHYPDITAHKHRISMLLWAEWGGKN